MKYRSTRGATPVTLDEALEQGIAPDGGLFLPEEFPAYRDSDFADATSIHDVAKIVLEPFFAESALLPDLPAIIAETFHFPIPAVTLAAEPARLDLLELFHGPTAAFKDVGAGFLAACLTRLQGDPDNPLTILVATSGDTGGAVAAAFNERPGMRVAVLYPDGRVSDRQAHQLTCWGDNVVSLAVRGSFDDCQALVKAAMADEALSAKHRFSSANSINIGRLMPQSIYYADASLRHYRETGRKAGLIVPTGNLGNALACYLARKMNLPIGPLILATNANHIIPDYLGGSPWIARPSIPTLASAMDVGNPSNMERLIHVGGEGKALSRQLRAFTVSDEQIREEIRRSFDEFGTAVCPHTATGLHAWRHLDRDEQRDTDWIVAATAHAAKFEQIVEPIIGGEIPVPEALSQILSRGRRFTVIDAELDALGDALDSQSG